MNGLLCSSQASVSRAAATSLESDQPWVKGWTVLGYANKWAPLGPAESRAPGRPSAATPSWGHPEEAGPPGLEELCNYRHLVPRASSAGFLPPDSILGAAWLKDDSTFGRAELKSLGFVQIAGEEWWARSNNTQALGSLFWHIPLWFTTQDTIFWLWCPNNQRAGKKRCCRLVAVSRNNNFKNWSGALKIHRASGAVNVSCPQEIIMSQFETGQAFKKPISTGKFYSHS